MIKGVTHAHLGPIWYHSEPSDVPYSPNHFLGWDFFCCFLQQIGSKCSGSFFLTYINISRQLFSVKGNTHSENSLPLYVGPLSQARALSNDSVVT